MLSDMVKKLTLILLLLLIFRGSPLFSQDWLDSDEVTWLKNRSGSTLIMGCDPYSGMEYFSLNGRNSGFVPQLAELMSRALGLRVVTEGESWNQVFNGLQSGSVDILFGANQTEERLKTMRFTEAIYTHPYVLMSRQKSDIYVVGDLEEKLVGFLDGDIVTQFFPRFYSRIDYDEVLYSNQNDALSALDRGEIDALITSGGTVVFDYLNRFPNLKLVKTFENISSDMTLSVRSDKSILAGILNKFLHNYKDEIGGILESSRLSYNYKVMGLTDEEINWIHENGTATVGVTDGYLPFELMDKGVSKGICAALIRQIADLTGIRFTSEGGDFDDLYNRAAKGEIHVMNIARTPDRLETFYFTRPFSNERDVIFGLNGTPAVDDIYGLGASTVAVIKGYWHRELIEKNSIRTRILETENLKESMKALKSGRADYLIENQSVMRYFIQEWEMYDIVEKGLTSFNSYMYFGIPRTQPELASVMDKALALVDTEAAFQEGYSEIPHTNSRRQIILQLVFIAALLIVLFLMSLFSYRQGRALAVSRLAHERLKEREEMMYRDPMTGIFNRHYLYHKVEPYADSKPYPQIMIICDLNNLKTANDTWGHAAGDQLLSSFASVLKASFAADDILIRQGGDEFMIIIFGKDKAYGEQAVGKMEELLEKTEVAVPEGPSLSPATAWGMALRNKAGEISFQDLQIKADNRMYQHKRRIKNLPG